MPIKKTYKKDIKRMRETGAWLEKYLSPDLVQWDYRHLADEAISLLDLDFALTGDEITLQTMEELGECFETKFPSSFDFDLVEDKAFTFIWNKTKERKDDIMTESRGKGEIEIWACEAWGAYRDMFKYKRKALEILQYIALSDLPYSFTLATFVSEEFNTLLRAYGQIAYNVKLGEHGLERSQQFINGCGDSSKTVVFQWLPVFSRMLFDFLLYGGQEYLLFCEYCGKFTITRRKGCKRFCSDTCRTNHGRANRV